MSEYWRDAWLTLVVLLPMVGCQAEVDSGPSYAELVVTYNAELEALDRLEAKREKLIKDYAATIAPNESSDALTQLEGLLKSANELKDAANEDTNSDPDSQLDGLAERGDQAQRIAGQLLDGLLNSEGSSNKPEPTPEEAAAAAERKKAFEAELAKLDAEIAKQQERVERARQARDEAESRSQAAK